MKIYLVSYWVDGDLNNLDYKHYIITASSKKQVRAAIDSLERCILKDYDCRVLGDA